MRIAVLGAESSGKSTLCEALARHYGTVWVPEYLREFVDTQQRVPFEQDQFGIARTQREREAVLHAKARRFLFCDTTPLMTALYSTIYWGKPDEELDALSRVNDYAVTLVTAPDTPWVPDGLQRESDEVRQRVHQLLLATLDERRIPFVLVSGTLPQRLRQVEQVLGSP
jgi:NadR type nicotinamide-nucleotide adenylyltransferase